MPGLHLPIVLVSLNLPGLLAAATQLLGAAIVVTGVAAAVFPTIKLGGASPGSGR